LESHYYYRWTGEWWHSNKSQTGIRRAFGNKEAQIPQYIPPKNISVPPKLGTAPSSKQGGALRGEKDCFDYAYTRTIGKVDRGAECPECESHSNSCKLREEKGNPEDAKVANLKHCRGKVTLLKPLPRQSQCSMN
jgi:hypothetical protein